MKKCILYGVRVLKKIGESWRTGQGVGGALLDFFAKSMETWLESISEEFL